MADDGDSADLAPRAISRRNALTIAFSGFIASLAGTTPAAAQEIGTQRWAFETDDIISSPPTVADGTVFAGSYDGTLYALDADTGEERWRFNAGGPVDSSPAVTAGRVFVGSQDGNLYAVDTETGNPQWRFETDDWVRSSPTVVDGTVYVGSSDGSLYAVAANTGDQRWAFTTGRDVSSPVVDDDTVFIGSADSNLYAVAAETGDERWTVETGDAIESAPAVADDTVFVATSGNTIHAVDAETGDQRWTFEAASSPLSSPTVADDLVFVGDDDGVLHAINAETGVEQWTFETAGRIQATPAVADELVYVGDYDGTLHALDTDSGGEEWAFEAGNRIRASTVADDTAYLGSGSSDGTLYAVATASSLIPFDVPNADPATIGGAVTATVGGYGFYRLLSGRLGSTDTSTDDLWATPENEHSATADGLSEQLETASSHLADARQARNADKYDSAVDCCDRAIETATAAKQTAESIGDDRSSKAASRLRTAEELKETLASERDAYHSMRDEVERITARINAADNERDAGNQHAALTYVEQAEELLANATNRANKHDFATITNQLDVAQSRCSRIRKLASDSPPSTHAQQQSQTPSQPTRSVPDTVPSTPALSLSYDDITKDEPIGQGGNADVYRATARPDTEAIGLAVKEPRMSGTINASASDQLLEEAATWQQLDEHDHIVSVVDYGETPLPWIAMEYMDGGDLGRRVGKLPFTQALWTALAITRGVRHAHKMGVAHLDLKPENILFRSVSNAWDVPKVADWGLSKHMLDQSQSVSGLSPQYAAPEQFDTEQFGPTDTVTDVYQLGAVFYELFTGQPTFEGDTYEIINKAQSERPSPPSRMADLPQGLDSILLRALATKKRDRYEDIILMRNDLLDLWEAYR